TGEAERLHRAGVRLRIVGDVRRFGRKIGLLIEQAEKLTAANQRLTLTIAANYGGRWDILQALARLAAQAPITGPLDEAALAPHLAMSYAPEPDLFIRTGGEQRISNFLLWLLVGVAGHEWARLCRMGNAGSWMYGVVMAAGFGVAYAVDERMARAIFVAATLFWILVAPIWLARGVRSEHRIGLAAGGFLVLVPAALALVVLRPQNVIEVLLLVWIADTAAYFVGRAWGRRKLAPSISPGKTWEGAWGGIAAAIAYAMIGGTFLLGTAGWLSLFLVGVALAV